MNRVTLQEEVQLHLYFMLDLMYVVDRTYGRVWGIYIRGIAYLRFIADVREGKSMSVSTEAKPRECGAHQRL
jgi:hypothetical protein